MEKVLAGAASIPGTFLLPAAEQGEGQSPQGPRGSLSPRLRLTLDKGTESVRPRAYNFKTGDAAALGTWSL